MEVRILRQDGKLGKRIYEADVPASMYALKRKMKKTLIGIGVWRNKPEPYLAILPHSDTNVFFSKDVIQDILFQMNLQIDDKDDVT